MRIAAIVFSGTGNSYRILKYIQDNIEDKIDVYDAIKSETLDINKYDYLIISYPIYGFNCPKPVIKYVKKIAKADHNIKCLVMKNSGEHLFWNNASSLYLRSLLKRRNISLLSEYHYLMPYSFIFKHTDYMAYRMDEAAKKLIPLDLKDFFAEKYVPIKRFFFDRPFAFILRIQWWGGRINGLFYRVDKNCIKCQKCVRECPANNIKFDGKKFHFGYQCLMCQKCVMYCPKEAIHPGMFSSWRVLQPYSFKEQKEFQKEKKPRYCKKNYERYFAYVDSR